MNIIENFTRPSSAIRADSYTNPDLRVPYCHKRLLPQAVVVVVVVVVVCEEPDILCQALRKLLVF
jgi:hypothetical protein